MGMDLIRLFIAMFMTCTTLVGNVLCLKFNRTESEDEMAWTTKTNPPTKLTTDMMAHSTVSVSSRMAFSTHQTETSPAHETDPFPTPDTNPSVTPVATNTSSLLYLLFLVPGILIVVGVAFMTFTMCGHYKDKGRCGVCDDECLTYWGLIRVKKARLQSTMSTVSSHDGRHEGGCNRETADSEPDLEVFLPSGQNSLDEAVNIAADGPNGGFNGIMVYRQTEVKEGALQNEGDVRQPFLQPPPGGPPRHDDSDDDQQQEDYSDTNPKDSSQIRGKRDLSGMSAAEIFRLLTPDFTPGEAARDIMTPSGFRRMCELLDAPHPLHCDWRKLAEFIGLNQPQIAILEKKTTGASKMVLEIYFLQNSTCSRLEVLGKLDEILKSFRRDDVREVIQSETIGKDG